MGSVKNNFLTILEDLIEVYSVIVYRSKVLYTLERRVKLNKRTLFHRKVPIIFADDIGLINYWN